MATGLLVNNVKTMPGSTGDILRAILKNAVHIPREYRHKQGLGKRDDIQLASNRLWLTVNEISLRCVRYW